MPATPAPLKTQAYRAILQRLLEGYYAPGDALDRRRMAEELQMSVAPVHEAMNQLEWEGLLVAIPRRGTQIRPVRPEDIYGHLVLREALECQVARLICGDRLREARPRLQPLAEAADSCVPDRVVQGSHEIAFHEALAELADCAPLLDHYRRVMHLASFYRVSLLLPSERAVADSHARLLDRLESDDPGVAAAAARHHIWAGKPACLLARHPHPGPIQA